MPAIPRIEPDQRWLFRLVLGSDCLLRILRYRKSDKVWECERLDVPEETREVGEITRDWLLKHFVCVRG